MMQGHKQPPKVCLGAEVDHQTSHIINPHAGWVKSSCRNTSHHEQVSTKSM